MPKRSYSDFSRGKSSSSKEIQSLLRRPLLKVKLSKYAKAKAKGFHKTKQKRRRKPPRMSKT